MKEPELNPKLPVSLPISERVLECLNLTNVTILSCEDFMKSLATWKMKKLLKTDEYKLLKSRI